MRAISHSTGFASLEDKTQQSLFRPILVFLSIILIAIALTSIGGKPARSAELWTSDNTTSCTGAVGVWTHLCADPYQSCIETLGNPALENITFTENDNSDGTVRYYTCTKDPVGAVGPGTIGIDRICTTTGNLSFTPCPDTLPEKTLGPCECSESAGNPINIATGNKYEEVVDIRTTGQNALEFRRFYNSADTKFSSLFAKGWRSNFDRSVLAASDGVHAYLRRQNGQVFNFINSSGIWQLASGNNDVQFTLVQTGSGWTVTAPDQSTETYDTSGKLLSVQQPNGYAQTLTYDGSGRLASVSDSDSRQLTFTFDTSFSGRPVLSTVTDPDGRVYTYKYIDARLQNVVYPDDTPTNSSDNPTLTYVYDTHGLIGIVDENGARYATWTYDPTTLKATSSEHGGGADHTTVAYNANGTVTVTNGLGKQATYQFVTVQQVPHVSQIDRQTSTNSPADSLTYTYDANGYVASTTDREGNVSTFVRNSRGLPTSITEADGTALARTTTVTWHSTYQKPTHIVAPNLTVDFTYDTAGNLLTRTETDTTTQTVPYSTNGQTRTWTYTHTATGQLATVDGPRSGTGDTTTYAYDTHGYISTVTNALSQTTTFLSVDGTGLPLSIQDANGVQTNLAYNRRGWLISRTVNPGPSQAKTTFTYDAAGNITAITLPNGVVLFYSYDSAHRLVEVTNGLGEKIVYTLNALGNVVEEDNRTASDTLKRVQTRTFDELGRMLTSIGASSQTTHFAYNKNSLVTSVTDSLSNVTSQAYDALNLLIKVTDPALHDVNITNNASDDTTAVQDQRTNTTSYVRDGFGDVIRQDSPDSGITDYVYDAAGNLTQMTDARGVVTQYAHDNLNRRTSKTFPAASSENVTYTYDDTTAGNKGVGRLTRIDDPSGSIVFRYDERGNIVQETRTIGTQVYVTQYVYDGADDVTQVTYPSGRLVNYVYDTANRVSAVSTRKTSTSATVYLASNITHLPFGPVATINSGNGQIATFSYDNDYRLTGISTMNGVTNVQGLAFGYNDADNLTSITDALNSSRNQSFGYDGLYRLTSATGPYGSITYGYDNVSNRTSQAVTNGGTVTTALSYPTGSNRLSSTSDGLTTTRSLTYTANGNITTDSRGAGFAYDYNSSNRLYQVKEAGSVTAQYIYNDLGERVVKALMTGQTTHYHFDLNGTLIAESSDTGTIQREYASIAGMPIAIMDPGTVDTPATTTVDNDGSGASSTGAWPLSTAGSGFEGTNYAVKAGGTGANSFTWAPTLSAAASYQVYAKWPGDSNRGSIASYTVHHSAGPTTVTVDQQKNTGQWNLLGTFPMDPAGSPSVVLSDAVAPLTNVETTIDNTDLRVIAVGGWASATSSTGYYGSNYVTLAAGGTGANTFTWPAVVPETGRYKVYARWVGTTLATSVKYTITHAAGNTIATVNQNLNRGQWNLLGTFDLDPTANHKVVLSDDTTGGTLISADAVQFVRDAADVSATEVIVDNDSAGTSTVGSWLTSTGGTGFQGVNYRNRPASTGANSFTWPASVGTTGWYKVYAKWSSVGGAPDAKYTVTHASGTTVVTLNQARNQGQWNLLGTFNINPASGHKVALNDSPNGAVVADAILFVRVPDATSAEEVVVDNTSTGTSSVGTWTAATTPTGFQESNYLTNAAGTGADTFTWPASISNPGWYKVYAKWVGTGAAPNAKYTVTHATGSTLVTVNQQQSQGQWVLLGSFNLAPSSGHQVTLSDAADSGNVIADATRFVRIADTRLVQADAIRFVQNNVESSALFVHTDQIGTPQKITDNSGAIVWDATARPFGEAPSITGTATNNLRFPGQYFDSETGFHYNYRRDYDPVIGRYVQSDPIGLDGGINTYSYGSSNPLRNVDPKGLQAKLPVVLPFPPVFWPSTKENKDFVQSIRGLASSIANALERSAAPSCRGENDCEAQVQRDEAVCQSLPNVTGEHKAIRSRCFESANARYGACVNGRPLPPLVTW